MNGGNDFDQDMLEDIYNAIKLVLMYSFYYLLLVEQFLYKIYKMVKCLHNTFSLVTFQN